MGRPSKYQPEFDAQAAKLCKLGATDKDLANFFEVDVTTIDEWTKVHPLFSQSLKKSKELADAKIEKSLYRRGLGYSHKAVKIFADPKTGAEKIIHYRERYAPDTTACIFWLKNRQPENWRDVKAVEHSGEVTQRHVTELTEEQIIERLKRIGTTSGAASKKAGKAVTSGVH